MFQPDVGANLVFALERITLSFLCTMGEHKVRPYTKICPKGTMFQPDVGANLMFALERITLSFLSTMGEHKVRPYTFLAHK